MGSQKEVGLWLVTADRHQKAFENTIVECLVYYEKTIIELETSGSICLAMDVEIIDVQQCCTNF